MPFAEPETAGGPYPRELVGHLLLIWPVDYIEDAPSKFSRTGQPSDVIVVDLVDLDEIDPLTGQPGAVARGAWWRPGRLIRSLKRRLGSTDPMLAWMTMGAASQGMNAPFELVSATGDKGAVERGMAWLEANPDFRPDSYTPSPRTEAVAQADNSYNPQPQPEGESSRVRSELERMARQAQEGADRLPKPPAGSYPY
jgi:hypothetical protein